MNCASKHECEVADIEKRKGCAESRSYKGGIASACARIVSRRDVIYVYDLCGLLI